MNRRRFFRTAALGAAGCLLGSRAVTSGASLRERLGVTTDEITPDFESALQFVRSFGLRWVEIRNLWDKYVTDATVEDCKRARSLLDAHGVKVSVLDTALYKCNLPGTTSQRKDDYPYAEQDALLRRAMERSRILGTRYIRVFSFWRPTSAEPVFDRIVEHLTKSTEIARAADRVLLLENVGGANAETGAEAARLLSAIPSPNFGLCWDPNNAFCGSEVPFPDGYRLLDKRRIHHVHLRDAARDAQTGRCQWLPVGKGKVDNLGLLRALQKDGFQGTLNLETHYQRPDRNKELATRESLEGLFRVIEEAEKST